MTNNQSVVFAERLKLLRESAGLSHDSLSKQIREKCGIDISSPSLKNYEVAEEYHSKFGKNVGMRVEYALALADFFGVSLDYLLGRTPLKSNDEAIEIAEELAGMLNEVSRSAQTIARRITAKGQRAALYGQVKGGQREAAMRGLKKLGGVV